MDAAHADRCIRRHDDHRIASLHLSGEHGSGHDGAMACEREDTIHGKAKQPLVVACRHAYRHVMQVTMQRCRSRIVGCGGIEWKDPRALQCSGGECSRYLGLHLLHTSGVDAVDLGQRDSAA